MVYFQDAEDARVIEVVQKDHADEQLRSNTGCARRLKTETQARHKPLTMRDLNLPVGDPSVVQSLSPAVCTHSRYMDAKKIQNSNAILKVFVDQSQSA